MPKAGVTPAAGVLADTKCDACMEVEAHCGASGLVKIKISLSCPGKTTVDPFNPV